MRIAYPRVKLQQLIRRQNELAARVILHDQLPQDIQYIAGIDVAFPNRGETTRAAVVVMDYPALNMVEQAITEQPTEFPYIPGFLSFREVPALLNAFKQIQQTPDLVLCDGQGIAHPRRFGLACHFGIETGLPAVGVAKSKLVGRYQEPGTLSGSQSKLIDNGALLGTVLRTRDKVKPVFISSGHRISLDTSVKHVLACARGYRLPEPTRMADKLAGCYQRRRLI